MSHYKHFSIEERESLLILKKTGKNITEIAAILKRNKSSISRELKRNSIDGDYSACAAEASYKERRKNCKRHKLLENVELKKTIQRLIVEEHWSPEEISGRLKFEGSKFQISYGTIYRGIYSGMLETHKLSHRERGIVRKLRHKGKRRRKSGETETRGKIVISHPISERPDEANNRSVPGHLEADTVLGKRGGDCLVTLVDRKLRFGWIKRASSKIAEDVNSAILNILRKLPAGFVKSITPDRGKEFADHALITKATAIEFYFPPPNSPWARGTNENFNGLLREFVPKKRDISLFSDDQICDFALKLNSRPRKCLGWKSPLELFSGVLLHLT
ncbi:MAG: IS30 family transposase [Clostridia bacterium]|nr:IS30 family transposase [Clostridia bacterium]